MSSTQVVLFWVETAASTELFLSLVCARFGTVAFDSFLFVLLLLLLTAAIVEVPGDSDCCNIRFLRIALAYRVDVIGDTDHAVDVYDS